MRAWLPLLCCPFLAGCIGLAYPSVCETPSVTVHEPDVRAFRVISECTLSGPCITGPFTMSRQVDELPVAQATVESQQDAYLAYSYMLFPLLNGSRSRSLEVFLYRPGYETVEIPARSWLRSLGGREDTPVVWKPAPDLTSQEAALHKVVSEHPQVWLNKEGLRFAAQEYTRLANSPLATGAAMAETRARLMEQARKCEDAANKRGRARAE